MKVRSLMTLEVEMTERMREAKPRGLMARLTDEEWEQLGEYLEERGMVKARFVERAIREKLEREKAKN